MIVIALLLCFGVCCLLAQALFNGEIEPFQPYVHDGYPRISLFLDAASYTFVTSQSMKEQLVRINVTVENSPVGFVKYEVSLQLRGSGSFSIITCPRRSFRFVLIIDDFFFSNSSFCVHLFRFALRCFVLVCSLIFDEEVRIGTFNVKNLKLVSMCFDDRLIALATSYDIYRQVKILFFDFDFVFVVVVFFLFRSFISLTCIQNTH